MECIIVIAWFVCGLIAAAISEEKGHSAVAGFFLGLLLGPVGVIVAAVISREGAVLEQRAVNSGQMRRCPYCAELVRPQATVCRYCGRDIPIAPLEKLFYTDDGLLLYKCRNCSKTYDLARAESCPYCAWRDPSRRKILDVYRNQATRDTA
jgi:uncharacterized membrane protein YeaQ/YmgE (transglycosylase-associated protein family)/RNA polymerase subunit RPABC4/transcription elongation factor Spt4